MNIYILHYYGTIRGAFASEEEAKVAALKILSDDQNPGRYDRKEFKVVCCPLGEIDQRKITLLDLK